ncbi:MAG: hypothetical protein WCS37_16510 [Chloroflexota bacterium]|nr:hypothetical protein [Chloroflexota bacterium]
MQKRVITYIPQQEEEHPTNDMGPIRRGLWMYTHKWGLNFSLVLMLALAYQSFVAIFIALRGVKSLPIFDKLPHEPLFQAFGITAALLVGFIIQGLIIAEMAQVVWLRRPDWLKVRLMSDSVWWKIMLVALIVSILVDFFLLFLSVTGTNNIADAWRSLFSENQMTIATTILLAILNLLTLLRCASVMRTSTSDEIRNAVEERLKAIAEEILIDAGDNAREKAAQVWKQLSVNPQRFIPIHNSVLNLISGQHPEIIPPQLGGDSWAYDFSGNTFSVLPPDLHQALLQRRYQATTKERKFKDEDQNHLWTMPPEDLAQAINYNIETYGRPRFVDASKPEQPNYLTRPVEFSTLLNDPNTKTGTQPAQLAAPNQAGLTPDQIPVLPTSEVNQFVHNLTMREKALFGAYLTSIVFPKLYNSAFPSSPDLNIFEAFDVIEIQWYYREWKKQIAQHTSY